MATTEEKTKIKEQTRRLLNRSGRKRGPGNSDGRERKRLCGSRPARPLRLRPGEATIGCRTATRGDPPQLEKQCAAVGSTLHRGTKRCAPGLNRGLVVLTIKKPGFSQKPGFSITTDKLESPFPSNHIPGA